MADKKISALTSATLPLAGTEVLPIVQTGATVKVATDDLTVKNIRSNATSGILQVVGPAASTTRVMTTPNANFTVARTDAAQTFTGDQTLSAGNIIPSTAAKGVNFTANTPAGGMTSQLLNWYEEGTFTPALKFGGGNTGMTGSFTGRYTRLGRLVFFTAVIYLTAKGSSTGNTTITGLPFTSNASSTYYEVKVDTDNVTGLNYQPIGQISTSSTTVNIYINVGGTQNNVTEVSFADTSRFFVTGFYEA